MNMQKVNWQNDGDNIRLTMPISKVDVEKREVSGWASLDNIDQHRDLVDASASRDAFKTFRGNIREQHDEKKAVGKLVNFREDTVYNPEDNKFYQGVYVTAYVSKGAQDTWEKVVDGTLSGFSIGGNVLDAENEVDETGNPFRRVKKYMLTELSLVDNPANQLANVLSIQKSVDTSEVELTGDLADITIENIFVCNDCLDDGHGVHKSRDESIACPICDSAMVQIGFVESSDPEPKETIKKMISDHLADREGGVTETMADENVVTEEVKSETVEVEEVQPATEEAPAEETTEEEAEVVEVEEVADPLSDAINSLRELTDRIEESSRTQKEEAETLRKSLDDLDKRFEERLGTLAGQVEELQNRQVEFSKKFEGIDESMNEVRKGLSDVDSATALKKSADFDQSAEEEKPGKSNFWAGSFLTID